MGQSPPSSTVSESGAAAGLPFLQGNAEFGDIYPAPEQICSAPLRRCSRGDLLISVRAPVGATNKADQDYCIGRGLAAVTVTTADRDFGWHALQYAAPRLRSVAQGTTFEAVGKKELNSLALLMPSDIREQGKIGEILDAVDDAIRSTETVLGKLAQVKQGLVHDLLSRGVDESGGLRDPRRHPEKFTETLVGLRPQSWRVVPIGTVARVRRGASPRPIADPRWFAEDGPGWVRISDVSSSRKYLRSTTQRLSAIGAVRSVPVRPGQVIMSIAATVGESIIVDMDARIHDGFVLIDQDQEMVRSEYLVLALRSLKQTFVSRGQTGTQANINSSIVRDTLMCVPDTAEQNKIVRIVDQHDANEDATWSSLVKLRALKAGLRDDLLTGRVRVARTRAAA